MNKKGKADSKGKADKKTRPKSPTATPGAPGWPAQGTAAGIKRASAGHDRKPVGRGAARGR